MADQHYAAAYQTTWFFNYKHSVFQSETRICLSFSQSQPQNMLKICFTSEGDEMVKSVTKGMSKINPK